MLLSFVIPCYRSEETIEKVIEEIIETVKERKEYSYEIICVNDCSPDHVYAILQRLAENNREIKVINFAKNMGKHAALLAGYAVVQGEIVVSLDDDYQCPVYELWKLIDVLERDECDIATASYEKKMEAAWKNMGSLFNRKVTDLLIDRPHGMYLENFGAMKLFVAKELIKYKNPYPYLEGLILRTTNRVASIKMKERERLDHNVTGYTFRKSVSLFLNGFTAFSVKPLRIATFCGMMIAFIGFIWAIYLVIRKIQCPTIVMGYTSITVILLILGGLILVSQGMLGEYIGRIYICLNESPQYVIRNTINIEEKLLHNSSSK